MQRLSCTPQHQDDEAVYETEPGGANLSALTVTPFACSGVHPLCLHYVTKTVYVLIR
jgi:hypothetical protein